MWEKGLNPLTTASFQAVVESDKVSFQPSFLQTKPLQVPQLLLTGLVLQTLHQLRCPTLDTLQHLNVLLVVRCPKPSVGFEVQPHQCPVLVPDLGSSKHLMQFGPLSVQRNWQNLPGLKSLLLVLP